jgi:hypothetical protein
MLLMFEVVVTKISKFVLPIFPMFSDVLSEVWRYFRMRLLNRLRFLLEISRVLKNKANINFCEAGGTLR